MEHTCSLDGFPFIELYIAYFGPSDHSCTDLWRLAQHDRAGLHISAAGAETRQRDHILYDTLNMFILLLFISMVLLSLSLLSVLSVFVCSLLLFLLSSYYPILKY